jgi:hypothetical protein
VTGAILLVFGNPLSAQLFSENFNDLNAATRWGSAFQLEATRDPSTIQDGLVNFAFDYSTLGIANPMGSGDTIGAAIGVNLTDQVGDEGETYIMYPLGQSFSGNFAFEADLFVYNDGAAGTTELGISGLFLNNTTPVAPYQWGTEGGPLAWIYSGEGGSTADLARFAEGNASATGYQSIADYNTVAAGTIPGFQTGVSGSLGPAAAPNANGSWVKTRVEVNGTTVSWYLNGALVDTYDNSGGFYSDGNIFFGLTDPFNSSNSGNRLIVDNVLVVIPEPSTYALGALGLAGLWLLKRRRK